MPPPIRVELVPHHSEWARAADVETGRLLAVSPILKHVHHIGSRSIPGIVAKPVLDLMVVVSSLDDLDACRDDVEALGYEWWGELGIDGRRYCTKSDPVSERRLVQLHCFADQSPHISRHLSFRDYLRVHQDLAVAYRQEKQRCAAPRPDDSHAYGDCKSAWIAEIESAAVSWWQSSSHPYAPIR